MAAQQADGAHKGELEEHRAELPDCKLLTVGFDCEFVECPQETDAYCPICLLVLREPHQVTCCGKSFCRSCIERVELLKNQCPTCNEQKFSFFADKRLKQVLYAFCVRCSHKKEGCQWTGELGELDKHLNVSPKLHEQLVGCQFTEVECHHCCDLFQRRYVTAHQIEECIRRPFSCDYCGNYGADFEDVTTKHWPVCGSYPVPCLNECGVYPECQNLEHHVSKDCPLTVVNCDFHYAGCKALLPRKHMSAHLAEDMAPHMALLAAHSERNFEVKISELREELTNTLSEELAHKDDQIAKLKEEIASCNCKVSEELACKDHQIAKLEETVAHTMEKRSQDVRTHCIRELREQRRKSQGGITRVRDDAQDGRCLLWIAVFFVLAVMAVMGPIVFSNHQISYQILQI